jgi:hypothetical protein
MVDQKGEVQPFPTRQVGNRDWEVLIEDTWVACDSEGDARALASMPILTIRCRNGALDQSCLPQLERAVKACERYGYNCYASRMLGHRLRELKE